MLEILKKIEQNKFFIAIILAVACIFTTKLLLIVYDKLIKKTKLDATICKILRITLKSFLLFMSIIIVLSSLGVSVSSLVATLSVVGVALSLAIQGFLSNVFGGIQIISNQPFKVGDFIKIDEEAGTVQEIGLFYTKLDTPDKKLIQIPNNVISNSTITNYSSATNRRVDINISVSYDCDIEHVKSVLLKILCDHHLTLNDKEFEPSVHVQCYNANDISYIARAWCKSPDYWTVYFDIMDAVKPTFDKHNITMSYPHVNVHMQ